jgi:hypothetical protein
MRLFSMLQEMAKAIRNRYFIKSIGFIVAVIIHLGMNSEAHSENPLKRVQEDLMPFL